MNIPNIRIKDVDNQIVLENARIVLYEFNEAHDIHEIRFSVESDELLQNDINSNNDIFYAQLGAQTSIILDDFKTILECISKHPNISKLVLGKINILIKNLKNLQ